MPAAAEEEGKGAKAAGCYGSDLPVVISLGSSCCFAVAQAGSVGLAGTQGSTLIGVCARTKMVRASHPGRCARGKTLTGAYLRKVKP